MNKLCCLIIMFFACGVCSGQNLVPNGDFELGPDSSSQGWLNRVPNCFGTGITVAGPDFWTIESGTPDRMIEGTIPTCNWDNDSAYSGNAYCVFGSLNFNVTEGGMALLINPLEQDSIYHLHYCVSHQTFNGFNPGPGQVAFIFNNGGDSIVSPLISSIQWQCYDTIFSSLANSSEIIIRGISSTFGTTNVDNVSLLKISSTSVHSIYPTTEKNSCLS